MSNYDNLTVKELRYLLQERGAKLSGRKAELVERLEAYERNFNFNKCRADERSEDFQLILPSSDTYMDLNSSKTIPFISREIIDTYLLRFEKRNYKDTEKLYNACFLTFLKCSTDKDNYFFKAQCRAEMRKTVKYFIDLKINQAGEICFAQCECTVGVGPLAHCKHVKCILLALKEFSVKKRINTETTCTQQLQTFHHPKPYHGTPIKASVLPKFQLKEKDSSFSVSLNNFNPLPENSMDVTSYNDYFRSTIANFEHCAPPMPISQLLIPANPHGLENDHTYGIFTPSECILKNLKVLNCSLKDAIDIQSRTKMQSRSKIWHKERKQRLQSSKFGSICKATQKRNMKKLVESIVQPRLLKCKAVLNGLRNERIAIEKFQKISNQQVISSGLTINPDYPYLSSSPDGLVGDEAVVEVKCPFVSRDKQITPQSVPYLAYDSNNSLSLKKSHDYFYQIQGQLLLTNRRFCYFIVYTFKDIFVCKVERDNEFIDLMVTKLHAFFRDFMRPVLLEKVFFKNYLNLNCSCKE